MRELHSLFSALHLVLVCFFLFLGIFFIALPSAYGFRFHMSEWLLQDPQVFRRIGWFVFSGGILLLSSFYFLNRKNYLELRMGGCKAIIEKPIIREYIAGYWEELFPGEKIPFDLKIRRKNRLEIIAAFPQEVTKEEVLQKAEKELVSLLQNKLGYTNFFYLTLISR